MDIRTIVLASVAATVATSPLLAKVDAEEAAKLGTELTPLGAEVKGIPADEAPHGLAIPAWDGGLTKKHKKFKKNRPPLDPFPDEKPLFVITGENYKDYEDILTEGHQKLFETFPKSYKMPVYPTHRTAAFPEKLYKDTIANATRVELTNEGNGFEGTAHGYPFPIPTSGREIMWNHVMRYRAIGYRGYTNVAVTTSSGDYVVKRRYLEASLRYNHPDSTVENLNNENIFVLTKIVAPPSEAGDAHLVYIPIDRIKQKASVWIYNAGQRRVRRIGKVGYDEPINDGLMTHDQIDMFNGPMDRYSFELKGKKTVLIGYNTNRIHSDEVKYKEILHKGHINQDLTRYELHRVWIVEAELRDGMTHIYYKRRFYMDEDSYVIHFQDIYDKRGDYWRLVEGHSVQAPHVPTLISILQVHYDLQSRRYVANNMQNEEKKRVEFDFYKPPSYYTTGKLKKFATKRY